MAWLEAENLAVEIDGRPLLVGVGLALEKGERLAVLGPNGAGKSTLLRALAGLLPSRGRLELAGQAVRERRLETLSAGERQRVALAAALAQETPLLLLDEPATALDVGQRAALWELLEERRRADGLAVVHVEHDPGEALARADRVLALREGRPVHAGPGGADGGGPWLEALYGHPFRRLEDGAGGVWWLPVRGRGAEEAR